MLKILKVKNFTCFSQAELKFSKGLNVFIGENGTGKSHLLKLGYVILRSLKSMQKIPAKDVYARCLADNLVAIFKPNSLGRLVSREARGSRCEVSAEVHKVSSIAASFSPKSTDVVAVEQCSFSGPLTAKPLFIPPKEVLSIFPGFALALENKDFAFDETYLDISKNLAGVPLKGERLEEVQNTLSKLRGVIEGDICLENNTFYLLSSEGKGKFEAHLMAEGSRKLAMVLYLLKIGELTKGSTLFWDEPEANLNPRFLQKLVEILFELSAQIQICIATHSLFLLRELDIGCAKKNEKNIRFFGLNFDVKHENVKVSQGESLDDIESIVALDEAVLQSERYREVQYGEEA